MDRFKGTIRELEEVSEAIVKAADALVLLVYRRKLSETST
jgi:hypothetical protein